MSQKHKVIIYKKFPCPYCDRAINFLNARNIQYELIDLTEKMDELQKIKQQWGWSTVPIIIVNDKLIGGYTDMKELDEKGEFLALLNSL